MDPFSMKGKTKSDYKRLTGCFVVSSGTPATTTATATADDDWRHQQRGRESGQPAGRRETAGGILHSLLPARRHTGQKFGGFLNRVSEIRIRISMDPH
jgi:hypothetical protein